MKSLRGLNDYRLKRQQCTFIANQQQHTQVSLKNDDTYGGTLDPYETKEPMEISSASVPTLSALGEGTLTANEILEHVPDESSTPPEDDVKVELDEFVTQWEDSEHPVKEESFNDNSNNTSQLTLNVLMKEE